MGDTSISAPVLRRRRPPPPRPPLSLDGLWHNANVRGLVYQALILVAVLGVVAWMIGNAQHALTKRGITTGFGFLTREAGFPIDTRGEENATPLHFACFCQWDETALLLIKAGAPLEEA